MPSIPIRRGRARKVADAAGRPPNGRHGRTRERPRLLPQRQRQRAAVRGRPSRSVRSTAISAISCGGSRSGFSRISSARSKRVDLSPAQFSVLVVIGANRGLSQAELGGDACDRAGALAVDCTGCRRAASSSACDPPRTAAATRLQLTPQGRDAARARQGAGGAARRRLMAKARPRAPQNAAPGAARFLNPNRSAHEHFLHGRGDTKQRAVVAVARHEHPARPVVAPAAATKPRTGREIANRRYCAAPGIARRIILRSPPLPASVGATIGVVGIISASSTPGADPWRARGGSARASCQRNRPHPHVRVDIGASPAFSTVSAADLPIVVDDP